MNENIATIAGADFGPFDPITQTDRDRMNAEFGEAFPDLARILDSSREQGLVSA